MRTPTKDSYWATLLDDHFALSLTKEKARRWFIDLRESVKGWEVGKDEDDPITSDRGDEINAELCTVIRHIKDLDYLPLKQEKKDGKRTKPLLKDIELWVFIYRKDMEQDPEFSKEHSELGYRRKLLGKMEEAWKAGDLITAQRITTHPDYVEGLEDVRGPSPEDSQWLIAKAKEQFGYDEEDALRAWIADRKTKGLPFYGSALLQGMADRMKSETAVPEPEYEEEL